MSARLSCISNQQKCLKLLQMGCFITHSNESPEAYHCGPCGTAIKSNLKTDYRKEMLVKQDNVFPMIPVKQDESSSLITVLRPYKDLMKLFPGMSPLGIVSQENELLPNEHLAESVDNNDLFKRLKFHEVYNFYHFVTPSSSQKWLDSWQRMRLDWFKKFSNAPSSFEIADEGKVPNLGNNSNSNGSLQELHVKFSSPWQAETIETITTYDETYMKNLESEVGMNLQVEVGKTTFHPHVIRITTSIDKTLLAYLYDAFTEKINLGKAKKVLTLHPKLAPYMVAIVMSQPSDDLRIIADYLVKEFRQIGLMTLCYKHPTEDFETQVDKYDSIGIPYTLLLDDKTLDTGISQLRSRDTTILESVHVTEVKQKLVQILDAS